MESYEAAMRLVCSAEAEIVNTGLQSMMDLAIAGHPRALSFTGLCLIQGWGCIRVDRTRGVRHLFDAIQLGDPVARVLAVFLKEQTHIVSVPVDVSLDDIRYDLDVSYHRSFVHARWGHNAA